MQTQQIFWTKPAFLLLFLMTFCSHRLYSQTSPNYHVRAANISSGASHIQSATNFQATGSVGQCTSSPVLQGTQFFMQSGFNGIVSRLEIVVSVPVADDETLPTVYRLRQNYPNPFNPMTTIQFDLPRQSEVTLNIFTINGQLVRTLVGGRFNAGSHSVVWDGRDERARQVTSGLYLTRMQAGEFVQHSKMLLIK